MKKLKGHITLLVERARTSIAIYDDLSGQLICEVELTPEQLSSALSRLSHTPCDVTIYEGAFERLGKTMEVTKLEFEIPEGLSRRENVKELTDLATLAAPEGWQPDAYFGSQDSFFNKDGKKFARCHIRRWVEVESCA